jgi:2-polyprenyl-3-methyl-5-hydroxy-6-metoxy-1,4-benzoquinol methylase
MPWKWRQKAKDVYLFMTFLIENPALLEAYDLVLLMDIIEHVDDDLGFLRAAMEHLIPGGVVVINVPAHMAFYSKYDEVIGHKRRYNRAQIAWLFRQAKMEPLNITYWGLTLLPPSLRSKDRCSPCFP